LKHAVVYYDLTAEDGPDLEVARAHSAQRDAAEAMLEWLRRRAYSGVYR
jgi:hypothetical protein